MPWHVATGCILLAIYVFIKEMKELLYFSVKVFFHSILSIFFRDVEIVGVQKYATEAYVPVAPVALYLCLIADQP